MAVLVCTNNLLNCSIGHGVRCTPLPFAGAGGKTKVKRITFLPLACMHQYFIKTPWLVKKIFSSYTWHIPSNEKEIYLTFDDGPHPTITPFVLAELKKYNALATFFCIGKNVVQYEEVYRQVIAEGHSVGNHTQHHLNGWKSAASIYLSDIETASDYIQSPLFRPPYGKITPFQAHKLLSGKAWGKKYSLIMWDVLSADFDKQTTPDECLKNVISNISNGSIIVFHDSEKAFNNLNYALPKVLSWAAENGFKCKRLRMEGIDGL